MLWIHVMFLHNNINKKLIGRVSINTEFDTALVKTMTKIYIQSLSYNATQEVSACEDVTPLRKVAQEDSGVFGRRQLTGTS